MPNVYARQTALHNVAGRVDYISNPKRQERLLGVCDAAGALLGKYSSGQLKSFYWELLAKECQAAHKHARAGTKVVEGRELVIQLSNSLLDRLSPDEICSTMAASFQERYDRPCTVALHWNKKGSNLHAHLIYSERQLLEEPVFKVAKRDMYMDAEGKRHYKKAEILDAAGELRPGCYIIEAGIPYEQRFFGPRDARFSRPDWLRDCKEKWVLPLRNGPLKGDVEIGTFDYSTGKLPLQHVGSMKNVDRVTARQIRASVEEYNDLVREYNGLIDDGKLGQAKAQKLQKAILQAPQRNGILQQALEMLRSLPLRRALMLESKRRAQLLVDRGMVSQKALQQVDDIFKKGKLAVVWVGDGRAKLSTFVTLEEAVERTKATAEIFKERKEAAEKPDPTNEVREVESRQDPAAAAVKEKEPSADLQPKEKQQMSWGSMEAAIAAYRREQGARDEGAPDRQQRRAKKSHDDGPSGR